MCTFKSRTHFVPSSWCIENYSDSFHDQDHCAYFMPDVKKKNNPKLTVCIPAGCPEMTP